MSDEISKSISQREFRKEDEGRSRMEQVANELRRRCSLDAGKSGNGEGHRVGLYEEEIIAEAIAKEWNIWYSIDDVFAMGTPGPSGSENDTYVDKKGSIVYKINNLIHTGSIIKLFDRLTIYNSLFPESKYELKGFTGFDGRTIMPLLQQKYIERAMPAFPEEIDNYMQALGFNKIGEWTYSNDYLILSDVKPRNVLKDSDGNLFVVDVEIKKIKKN